MAITTRRSYLLFLLFLILIFLFLSLQLDDWTAFFYRPGSEYSDLTITFWPNLEYIKRTLFEYGQFPLWRTTLFSGSPLDVDPQSGLWYWPNVLVLILPTTIAVNVLIGLHFALAGWGMWRWAVATGASSQAALLSGLAYLFAPKVFAHLGFGHLGLVYASAYIPWILGSSLRLSKGEWQQAGFLGLALGLQFIANPQLSFYTAFSGGFYLLAATTYTSWKGRKHKSADSPKIGTTRYRPGRVILAGGVAAILALMVMAVQLVPLLTFAGASSRSTMGLGDSAISSLPPRYLWGLVLADYGGYMDYMMYAGIVVLILGIFALRRKQALFWWGFVAASWIYALGSYTPVYSWIFRLIPALVWLRAPSRLLFVTAAVLSLLAGWGFDRLRAEHSPDGRRRLRLTAWGFSLVVLLLLGGYAVWIGAPPLDLFALGTILPAGFLLIILFAERRIGDHWAVLGLGFLLLVDLWALDGSLIEGRPAQEVFRGSAVAQYLRQIGGEEPFRVYSPDYSIPQQVAVIYDLEAAGGVDPLFTQSYDVYMELATGVRRNGYGVTVPAMGGNIAEDSDLTGGRIRANMLGALNVRYIISKTALNNQALVQVPYGGDRFIYEISDWLPRVYLAKGVVGVDRNAKALEWSKEQTDSRIVAVEGDIELVSPSPGDVQIVENTPNRQQYRAIVSQATLMIISQGYYPGWQAEVDGEITSIYRVNGALTGIYLTPGEHRIRLQYQPDTLWWGIGISLAGIVLCAGMILSHKVRG